MKSNKLLSVVGVFLITLVFSFNASSGQFGNRIGFFSGQYHLQDEDVVETHTPSKFYRIGHSYRINKHMYRHIEIDARAEDRAVDDKWKPGSMRLMNTIFR